MNTRNETQNIGAVVRGCGSNRTSAPTFSVAQNKTKFYSWKKMLIYSQAR